MRDERLGRARQWKVLKPGPDVEGEIGQRFTSRLCRGAMICLSG